MFDVEIQEGSPRLKLPFNLNGTILLMVFVFAPIICVVT